MKDVEIISIALFCAIVIFLFGMIFWAVTRKKEKFFAQEVPLRLSDGSVIFATGGYI